MVVVEPSPTRTSVTPAGGAAWMSVLKVRAARSSVIVIGVPCADRPSTALTRFRASASVEAWSVRAEAPDDGRALIADCRFWPDTALTDWLSEPELPRKLASAR